MKRDVSEANQPGTTNELTKPNQAVLALAI